MSNRILPRWALPTALAVAAILTGHLGAAPAQVGASEGAGPVPGDPVQVSPVRVGVLVDGESATVEALEEHIRRELAILVEGEFEVRFEARHRLSAAWTPDGADGALRTLLADPEVDLVLAVGLLASQRLCCLGKLPKPVVATTVVDAELQGLPRRGVGSGVRNLVYVDLPESTLDELRAFYDVAPFTKVVFMVSREIADGVPQLIGSARQGFANLGLDADIVQVSDSAEQALRSLDAVDDADAVYVWPLYRFDDAALAALVDGLIVRGLPSFSALGGREVEAGLMATRQSPQIVQRVARRVALNVQRILLGEHAGTLPVELGGSPQLTLNLATADALGLEPRWQTWLEAELIGEAGLAGVGALDLQAAMAEAIEANLDLRAGEASLVAGEQDIAAARAVWRPQLTVGLTAVVIDDDRAEASLGQVAERSLSAGLDLAQLIYDEGAAANVDIQRALQRAREASFDSLRLDIGFEAGVTYLELLRAETLQRVRRSNLDLTRENLAVAELRRDVGAANPSEVYRWQAQISSDRQALIEAAVGVEKVRLALNRLLHRPLETDFVAAPVGLGVDFLFDQEQIRGFIATPERFRVMRDFSVAEGLEQSPDLRALRESIEVQRRRLEAARRAFYIPSFAAQLSLDRELDTAGAGSDVVSTFGEPADETDWSLGLSGSLALLTGGARTAEQIQAQEEIARLELELASAEESIAEAIRAAMFDTRASFLSIDLARQSADAARQSQDLVADAYARGVVSILDLLDAQNAALSAELAATNAIYDFFIDLLRLERTTSRFYSLLPQEERAAWLRRLAEHFAAQGLGPWSPPPFATAPSESAPSESAPSEFVPSESTTGDS